LPQGLTAHGVFEPQQVAEEPHGAIESPPDFAPPFITMPDPAPMIRSTSPPHFGQTLTGSSFML